MNYLKNLRPAMSRLARSYSNKPTRRRPAPNSNPPPPAASRSALVVRKPAPTPNPPPPISRSALVLYKPAITDALARHYNNTKQAWEELPRLQRSRTLIWLGFTTSAMAAACCYGTLETVPYSNRTHFIVLTPGGERRAGEFQFARMKELMDEEGKAILPESHPDSVRVTRLAMEIVRAAHKGFDAGPEKSPYGVVEDSLEAAAQRDNDDRLVKAGSKKKRKKKKEPQTKHLDGLNWEVVLVEDKNVNACCLPGGKIMVNTGFLRHFKTDAELATVLGHEVGHIIARHAAEQITKNMWIFILELFLLIFCDDDENNPKNIATLTELILKKPFSRKMELEADHIGVLLLAAAGYDPRDAPAFYEKLGKTGGGKDWADFLSTHPSSKKRAQNLSQDKVMDKAMELYREVVAGRESKGFFFVFR
ncbi:hypothetical protein BRADI_3g59988v3 [Brachypodium distachyon]|uniref:Peptidase M48 domain-containing protein n=2 Tax=Brachypodium distachyon TaxID=15368 RepID=A0A0Q3MCL1_BRADI|nr:hypothetical protein BRADI_3g59988v3 [Brachypodium distachyon]